jgi:hypothetical protein
MPAGKEVGKMQNSEIFGKEKKHLFRPFPLFLADPMTRD